MTYYAQVRFPQSEGTLQGKLLYNEVFNQGTPLENRRAAISRIKELIAEVKSKELYQFIKSLGVLQVFSSVTGQPLAEITKDILLKNFSYSVCFHDESAPDNPPAIESNHLPEEWMDFYRVIEYQYYLTNRWDTGGKPVEVYIPRDNIHLPILAANSESKIGLRQLLLTGS